MTRLRFDGWIAGTGTEAGVRIVVGHWPGSPFGPFTDVMVEHADGLRELLAPDRRVADFVSATYEFDRVTLTAVEVRHRGRRWHLTAGPLDAVLLQGRRSPLGWLLRAVPPGLAARPAWVRLVAVPARLLPGVRATGSTAGWRREWYGARDLHRLRLEHARWGAADLGAGTDVRPAVRFGFGSVPRRPSLVRVTTTVEVPDGDATS